MLFLLLSFAILRWNSAFGQDLGLLGRQQDGFQQAVLNGDELVVWKEEQLPVTQESFAGDARQSDFLLDVSQNEPYFLDWKYHKYDAMTKFLRKTSATFPNLTALYSIGKSVQGKWCNILVLNVIFFLSLTNLKSYYYFSGEIFTTKKIRHWF